MHTHRTIIGKNSKRVFKLLRYNGTFTHFFTSHNKDVSTMLEIINILVDYPQPLEKIILIVPQTNYL